MATVSYEAMYAAIQSIIAGISAGGPITITSASKAYGTDFRITPGAAKYQIQISPRDPYGDSNVSFPRAQVTIWIHCYVNSTTTQTNFLQKTMYYVHQELLKVSAWEAMTGVYSLEPDTEPEISEGEQNGKVVSFAIVASVLLDPE